MVDFQCMLRSRHVLCYLLTSQPVGHFYANMDPACMHAQHDPKKATGLAPSVDQV